MNYSDLTDEELKEKIATARVWLKENENHKKYTEGLKRYVQLVGILRKRENGWIMGYLTNP